jgi:hypothetical protein
MTPRNDDLARLFDELHAARTRCEAEATFFLADHLFIKMGSVEREKNYRLIDDILNEKPDTED